MTEWTGKGSGVRPAAISKEEHELRKDLIWEKDLQKKAELLRKIKILEAERLLK